MQKFEAFKNKLISIYSNDKLVNEIIDSHKLERKKFFWVKKNSNAVKKLNEKKFDVRESFLDGLFFTNTQLQLISQTDEFNSGEIYIQNPSSYMVSKILNVEPSDKFVDMCASPGSKTLAIANSIGNGTSIVAIEKSKPRFFKMKENFKKLGFDEIRTVNLDANFYLKKSPQDAGTFDKVLLDAPCSTESHINLNDIEPLKTWRPNVGKQFSKIQKGLINTAIKLCMSGGEIVYSTCTYSVEENEKVVKWILKREQNLELQELKFPKGIKVVELEERMYRIIPDENCEAFFICKFKKN